MPVVYMTPPAPVRSLHSGYGLRLTDVFTGEVQPTRQEILMPRVPSHGCAVYRASMEKVK